MHFVAYNHIFFGATFRGITVHTPPICQQYLCVVYGFGFQCKSKRIAGNPKLSNRFIRNGANVELWGARVRVERIFSFLEERSQINTIS